MPSSPPDPYSTPTTVADGDVVSRPTLDDVRSIGRHRELDSLRRVFDDVAEQRRVMVVNLIGVAGAGKSTLLRDLTTLLREWPGTPHVLYGRATVDGTSAPRGVLRSVVGRGVIRNDDTSTEVVAKLRTLFPSLTPQHSAIVGHWLGFDLADADGVRDLIGNPEFGTIALGHLVEHFRTLVAEAPIALIIDDVETADAESLDAVVQLVDALGDAPLLVVCATDPALFDVRPNWSAAPDEATITMRLASLDDAHQHDHVVGLLGRSDGAAMVADGVTATTGGNPLSARLIVETLVDDGIVVPLDGGWRVDVEQLVRVEAPQSPAAAAHRRLASLGPDEAVLVGYGATIGMSFWDDAVVALARARGQGAQTHAEALSLLDRLDAQGVIRRETWSAFTGCRQYRFTHAALRSAGLARLAPSERTDAELAAAGWLERHPRDRVGERVALIAEHLVRAGEDGRSADLFHEAASLAALTGAVQASLRWYERSLACRADAGTADGLAATSTRIEYAHLLAAAGRNDEAAATYRTAETDARRNGSQRLAANAMAGAMRTAAARGDWDEAGRLVEQVAPLAERFGGDILGRYLSGQALLLIDGPAQDLAVAERLTERSLQIWRELENPSAELRAFNELGLMSSKAGRPEQANAWYEQGLALARRVGDTSGEWILLQNQAVQAHLAARSGALGYDRAIELYRASLDRRRRLGLPHILILANLAQAEVESGRGADGTSHALEALRIGWSRHDPIDWTIALITLAQVAFVDDRPTDGLDILTALLAERRTPSLEREIAAVLKLHGVDRSVADAAFVESSGADLGSIVDHLLGDQPTDDLH